MDAPEKVGHGPHDEPRGEDLSPVRVAAETEVGGGLDIDCMAAARHKAVDPASIGMPVKDPSWCSRAMSVTLSIHADIDASCVPIRISSNENVRLNEPVP